MPTILKETVHPMASHSSKEARKTAADFIAHVNLNRTLLNNEESRRAKNVADAKARDLRIKERAAAKAKERAA